MKTHKISLDDNFGQGILTGDRKSVITKLSKNGPVAGDKIMFFRKDGKLPNEIAEGYLCKSAFRITISKYGVIENKCLLNDKEVKKFVKEEGFKNFEKMLEFFKNNKNYGLPFVGMRYKW